MYHFYKAAWLNRYCTIRIIHGLFNKSNIEQKDKNRYVLAIIPTIFTYPFIAYVASGRWWHALGMVGRVTSATIISIKTIQTIFVFLVGTIVAVRRATMSRAMMAGRTRGFGTTVRSTASINITAIFKLVARWTFFLSMKARHATIKTIGTQ